MRGKSFRLAERDGGGAERAQLLRPAFEQRGALHEIEHAEARRKARRARGRQHVVGAGDVIADGFRRMRADEDRAGIADFRHQRLGVVGGDLQMLGRELVDQRDRVGKLRHQDDGAEIAPRRAGDLGARQRLELRFHRLLDLIGERGVVGDQDRLRAGVVLGLRQEVGGDPIGVAGLVGEDQHLGRAGDHVDADLAEDETLGRRHIGVAGPDDLGDRLDRLGAVGERGHGLRAADAIDLVDAGELGRRQHQRGELAVRRRHHHDQPRAAGDLGRHRVHQHRRRIGRGAARHVKPDRFDRGPARAHFDAERVGEALVVRLLAQVIGLDAVARELERGERLAARRISPPPRSPSALTRMLTLARSRRSNSSVSCNSARSP